MFIEYLLNILRYTLVEMHVLCPLLLASRGFVGRLLNFANPSENNLMSLQMEVGAMKQAICFVKKKKKTY